MVITVSVAGSDTRRLAAEGRRMMIASDDVAVAADDASAEAIRNGGRLLAVMDRWRHGCWWRVHVHQHHGATLAAAALPLRQQDLRVQLLQLRLLCVCVFKHH